MTVSKEHKAEYNRKYYRENRERIMKYNSDYYEEHKEQIAERKAKWYQALPPEKKEENKIKAREFYARNRKRISERRKELKAMRRQAKKGEDNE